MPVAQTKTVHVARGHLIDHPVGHADQLLVNLPPFLGLEVQGYGLLAPHLVDEIQAALLARNLALEHVFLSAKGSELPCRVSFGGLDVDHLGPGLAEQAAAKLVAHSPEPYTDKSESLQGLRFSKGIFIPEVVLTPFAEIFRLPPGVHLCHVFRRRRRRHRPGPDVGMHQINGVGPAVYFYISLFCHVLTSHLLVFLKPMPQSSRSR